MRNKTVIFMVEVAIFGVLGYLLDLFSFKLWAQGGSISFAMLPIFIISYRWGVKGGLLTGLMVGLLQVVAGQPYIYTPVQAFLDYFVAFSIVGTAGIFASKIRSLLENGRQNKAVVYIVAGAFLGSLLRYAVHVYSGVVFFGEYAPEGTPVFIYSLVYNLTYMGPAFLLSAMVLAGIVKGAERLVLRTT